jgi:hypothetical protein
MHTRPVAVCSQQTCNKCLRSTPAVGIHSAYSFKFVYVSHCAALSIAISLIHYLGQSPVFVDTLLLQNPSLLDALLTKANSSPRDHEEVSMLSHLQYHKLTLCSMLQHACSSFRGHFQHSCPCPHQRRHSFSESSREPDRVRMYAHSSQCTPY